MRGSTVSNRTQHKVQTSVLDQHSTSLKRRRDFPLWVSFHIFKKFLLFFLQALFCVKSSIIFHSFLTCSSGSLKINPSAKRDFLQLSYMGSNIVIIGKNGKFKSLNSYNFNIMVRANLSFGKQNLQHENRVHIKFSRRWAADLENRHKIFLWQFLLRLFQQPFDVPFNFKNTLWSF